jgi:hypothetical protein
LSEHKHSEFFFLCTFAAIPLAGRRAFNRMKPVASAWLQALVLASIMAFSKLPLPFFGKANREVITSAAEPVADFDIRKHYFPISNTTTS